MRRALAGLGALAVIPFAQAGGHSTAPAGGCDPGVKTIFSVDYHLARIASTDGEFAVGHAHLTVNAGCYIKKGESDLRLQERGRLIRHHYDWITRGDAAKKNWDGADPGDFATMAVHYPCNVPSVWRLRLFGAPGTLRNGTTFGPQVVFYPRSTGKAFNCTGIL